MSDKDQALRECVASLKEAEACLGLEVILQGREPDLKKWQAAIALGDSALSMPVQSHEAWADQTMGIVTHISELHSRCLRHDTKALHDAWTAKKAELRAHLNNHPAAVPEGSQTLMHKLRNTLSDTAWTKNLTASDKQFSEHLQKSARDALSLINSEISQIG